MATEVMTTRQLKVVVRGDVSEKDVWFSPWDDDVDDYGHGVIVVPIEDYREMGEPEHLTLAIWPGDRQDLMEGDLEQAQAQIDKLAGFIMGNIPGEPSESQGAVDTAIRLLDKHYGPPAGTRAHERR